METDQDTDTTRNTHTLPVMKQMKSSFSIITQGECPSQASDTHQWGISSTTKTRRLPHLRSPDPILRVSVGSGRVPDDSTEKVAFTHPRPAAPPTHRIQRVSFRSGLLHSRKATSLRLGLGETEEGEIAGRHRQRRSAFKVAWTPWNVDRHVSGSHVSSICFTLRDSFVPHLPHSRHPQRTSTGDSFTFVLAEDDQPLRK